MAKLEVDDALLEGLDRFIDDRHRSPRGHMTRGEAASAIIRDWLMSQGYVPLPNDPDTITTALDGAEVPKA
ncbi:hypothetical protein [Devosia sp. LjRoot3]|uniref:hypothetical protein n=1 Tax=Devosia sp. LjRoot3 TaxID=3342319 RepID=UPI003ECE9D94